MIPKISCETALRILEENACPHFAAGEQMLFFLETLTDGTKILSCLTCWLEQRPKEAVTNEND